MQEKVLFRTILDSDVTFYPEKTQIFVELVDNLEKKSYLCRQNQE